MAAVPLSTSSKRSMVLRVFRERVAAHATSSSSDVNLRLPGNIMMKPGAKNDRAPAKSRRSSVRRNVSTIFCAPVLIDRPGSSFAGKAGLALAAKRRDALGEILALIYRIEGAPGGAHDFNRA